MVLDLCVAALVRTHSLQDCWNAGAEFAQESTGIFAKSAHVSVSPPAFTSASRAAPLGPSKQTGKVCLKLGPYMLRGKVLGLSLSAFSNSRMHKLYAVSIGWRREVGIELGQWNADSSRADNPSYSSWTRGVSRRSRPRNFVAF